jgi:hypothetical protein
MAQFDKAVQCDQASFSAARKSAQVAPSGLTTGIVTARRT